MIKKYCYSLLVSFFLMSCVSYNSLKNYNQSELPAEPQIVTNYAPIKLKTNDLLQIDVNSIESEAVKVFSNSENQASGYLISEDGNIDFPLLGKVFLKGKTTSEATIEITKRLGTYFIKPPIVNMRLINFKVNIHGEVSSPKSIAVNSERFSLIDAITEAGDFTHYSRRDSILIIRENDGIRSFGYVDFNSIEVMNSPYFYLQQNDVIYVQPTKNKLAAVRGRESTVLPWISIGVSLILLVTTLIRIL